MKRKNGGADKRGKQVPVLKGEKAIAEFWDTHDITEYWDSLEEVKEPIVLDPQLEYRIRQRHKKRLLTLRLERGQIENAKRIAARKGMGYQTLLRSWIEDGIRRDWAGSRLAKKAA